MSLDRTMEILLLTRDGALNADDATRAEVDACVEAGLLKWALPDGRHGYYNVALAPLGVLRLGTRLGFV